MKKIASCILALICLFSFAHAEVTPEGINVFVSITDDQNNLVLAYEPVFVTDQDNDGTFTIADALACAHAQKHENGAEAFAYAPTEYGLSLTLLWGIDNGGSYGYMVNDSNPMSLSDAVYEEDHIKAYCYTDLVAWTDTYSFFTFPYADSWTHLRNMFNHIVPVWVLLGLLFARGVQARHELCVAALVTDNYGRQFIECDIPYVVEYDEKGNGELTYAAMGITDRDLSTWTLVQDEAYHTTTIN